MALLTAENRLRIAWLGGAVAALSVIAAQFMDYTGFQIGAGGIESANEVAPRPIVLTSSVGEDQLWLGIPLAIAALVALRLAAGGQWRAGRTVATIGAVVLVLTAIVLLPNGTDLPLIGDEDTDAAVAYDAADEKLLRGFWFQLGGGLGLVASGIAMASMGSVPKQARPQRAPRRASPA